MFISLSRRSVPLIDRLGQMIDDLELAEDDPDRLSDLFSIDHLVTRMRRNSENLLVLAGEEPVRKWTEPVPLTDVVRAATSEIEQYSRVLLDLQPGIVVSGHAAADVVHLLAEIIENATMFSPADTSVRVSGHEVSAGGVLLEVRDNGIGISPSRLSRMNWRLENPPLIDVSVSQHMGLFAVSRLAARRGVRVRLQAATPQGLSALVWLPRKLTGRETARDVQERSRLLAEGSSFASPGTGARRARGGTEQPMAATRRASSWFRAQRPSGRRAQGAALSATELGAVGSVPAAAQVEPATPVHDTPGDSVPNAPSTPAQQAPGLGSRPGDGMRTTRTTRTPAHSDRTAAGLPLRTPGVNLIPSSAGATRASGPAADEAQVPGWQPESPGTGGQAIPLRQGPPPRRSPEKARSRLGGFQLGSREAETGTPNAGEEANR
jgi:hypothetical protein